MMVSSSCNMMISVNTSLMLRFATSMMVSNMSPLELKAMPSKPSSSRLRSPKEVDISSLLTKNQRENTPRNSKRISSILPPPLSSLSKNPMVLLDILKVNKEKIEKFGLVKIRVKYMNLVITLFMLRFNGKEEKPTNSF